MRSFDDYRDTMLGIIGTAESYFNAECPRDSAALDLARARMSRILTAYHLFADRELFTPCLTATDPAHRMRVREIAAECATLAADFRAFTRDCALRPVTENWADYRQRGYEMSVRIRRHLHSAEREVRRCEALSPADASSLEDNGTIEMAAIIAGRAPGAQRRAPMQAV